MSEERSAYEGRKGQKRLKAIEKHIKSIEEEFEDRYAESEELRFLREEVSWTGMAGLVFVLARRDVNFRWQGMMDYGYLRLCRKWLQDRGVRTVDTEQAVDMMKDVLPDDMCFELREELAALEIS